MKRASNSRARNAPILGRTRESSLKTFPWRTRLDERHVEIDVNVAPMLPIRLLMNIKHGKSGCYAQLPTDWVHLGEAQKPIGAPYSV